MKDKPTTKTRSGLKLFIMFVLLAGPLALAWYYMYKVSTVSIVKNEKKPIQIKLPDKPSIVVLPFATIFQETEIVLLFLLGARIA